MSKSIDFDGLDGIMGSRVRLVVPPAPPPPSFSRPPKKGPPRALWAAVAAIAVGGVLVTVALLTSGDGALEEQLAQTAPAVAPAAAPAPAVEEPVAVVVAAVAAPSAPTAAPVDEPAPPVAARATQAPAAVGEPPDELAPVDAAPASAPLELPAHFGFDSARPMVTARAMRSFVGQLKLCAGRILITGHACALGSEAANVRKGLARARATEKLLVRAGIERQRIDVASAGSAEPLATNETPRGRRANRRVTVTCSPTVP